MDREWDSVPEPRFLPYDHEQRLAAAMDFFLQDQWEEQGQTFSSGNPVPVSENWSYYNNHFSEVAQAQFPQYQGPVPVIPSPQPQPPPQTTAEKKAVLLEVLKNPSSGADLDFKSKFYKHVLYHKMLANGNGLLGFTSTSSVSKPSGPGPSI